jgi:hypothetical protein
MNDSEKLELLSIHAEIQKLVRDLNKIEARVKKVLSGMVDTPIINEQPKKVVPNQEGPKSIHDTIDNLPPVSSSEVRAHTMEFIERITK